MSWKNINSCPKNAPKKQKKPIAQRRNVDTIGFENQDYLTASLTE